MVTQIDLRTQSGGTSRSLNMKPLQNNPEAACTLKLSLAPSPELSLITNLADRVKTVGYRENSAIRTIEQFMADPAALLIDIRYSPKSSIPQWNQSALRKRPYGDRYHWIQTLGNQNFKQPGNIKIADSEAGIAQLLDLLQQGHKLLLLCACPDYETCHRKGVYNLLEAYLQDTADAQNAHLNSSINISTNYTKNEPKEAHSDADQARNSNQEVIATNGH